MSHVPYDPSARRQVDGLGCACPNHHGTMDQACERLATAEDGLCESCRRLLTGAQLAYTLGAKA